MRARHFHPGLPTPRGTASRSKHDPGARLFCAANRRADAGFPVLLSRRKRQPSTGGDKDDVKATTQTSQRFLS